VGAALLASTASWAWAGAAPIQGGAVSAPAAQVQGTVQDMQTTLSIVYAAAAKAGPEAMRQSAGSLETIRQQVPGLIDPTGLRQATLMLSQDLDHLFNEIPDSPPAGLQPMTKALRALQSQLEALAGPEHQAEIRRRLREADADRTLHLLRGTVERYSREHDDWPPLEPARNLVPGYLAAIPALELPGHKPESGIRVLRKVKDDAGLESQLKDTGGWVYVADIDSPFFGRFFIDCTHLDTRDLSWHQH
jgi:hypothetical protein